MPDEGVKEPSVPSSRYIPSYSKERISKLSSLVSAKYRAKHLRQAEKLFFFFVSLELDSRISSLSSTGRSVPCNATDPQKLSRNGATGKPFSRLLAAQSNLKVIHAKIYVLPTRSDEFRRGCPLPALDPMYVLPPHPQFDSLTSFVSFSSCLLRFLGVP